MSDVSWSRADPVNERQLERETTNGDHGLVSAAQADPAAFDHLYEQYVDSVYRYLRARAASDADAEDLTQQVFLKAFTALPGYRTQGIPFAAWLFRIAHNVATDAYRRRSVARSVPLPDTLHATSGDPESILLQGEDLNHMRALIAQLDDEKRNLLALRFAAGLTAREIAQVVGKSESAIKQQFTRLMHALKEEYRHGK